MSKPERPRLLITGGGSYLGRHLVPRARATFVTSYTTFQHDPFVPAAGHRLDVREATAVSALIETLQPQVIIHTVGSNRGPDMERVIQAGTENVTTAAKTVGARLIHLSSDSIFAGEAPPYDETAVPSPLNAYGRAKAAAETIALAWENCVIVRTSLIYGLQVMDHGTQWMARDLRAGRPVTLFDNQMRNPVWVQSLADACLELATASFRGILNVAGAEVMSRAAFSLEMLDYWDIESRDTLSIGPATPGRWPRDCELDLTRATAVLQTPLPGVATVLNSVKKS